MDKLTKKQIMYHIFSNNIDWYTSDKAEAKRKFKEYKRDIGCARLYEITDFESEETEKEDCIKSFGGFPA